MEIPERRVAPGSVRFSLAGAFSLDVVLASMIAAPPILAEPGPFGISGLDKWVHVGSFVIVTLLLAHAVQADSIATLLAIAFGASLLGVGIELVQSTIPWRTMEFTDVVANTVGVLLGLGSWAATTAWPIAFAASETTG